MFVWLFLANFSVSFCDVSPSLSTLERLNTCILPVLMPTLLTADSITGLIEEAFRRPDIISKLNSCEIKSLKLYPWRFFTGLIARIHHQIKILQIVEMQCHDDTGRNYIVDVSLLFSLHLFLYLIFFFRPKLFRSTDMFPVLGAAWVWLVRWPQQHREGPLHGGLLSGPDEETGKARPASPGSSPVPRHEPRAG